MNRQQKILKLSRHSNKTVLLIEKKYKRGDIVLIDVPFQNRKLDSNRSISKFKRKTVLIISNEKLNSFYEFIFIPITKNKSGIVNNCLLSIPKEHLSNPSYTDGYLRFNKISTLNKSEIIKKVNEVSAPFLKTAIEKLNTLLK